MCSICDAKIAEAQLKSREAVSASAEKLCQMLEATADLPTGEGPSRPEVEEWLRQLSSTILAVVSCDTLTEMLLSVPPHGDDKPSNH